MRPVAVANWLFTDGWYTVRFLHPSTHSHNDTIVISNSAENRKPMSYATMLCGGHGVFLRWKVSSRGLADARLKNPGHVFPAQGAL